MQTLIDYALVAIYLTGLVLPYIALGLAMVVLWNLGSLLDH